MDGILYGIEKILYGIEKIVVESQDGKDVIATIAEDGIDTAEGYRVRMKPTVAKHKLFISCPMSGRSENDIRKSFEKMQKIAEAYTGEILGLVNPYEPKVCSSDADAISCLADSIKLMANADYFIGIDEDWRFRGAEIEKNVARSYGLKIIPVSFKWVCPDVDERYTWNVEQNFISLWGRMKTPCKKDCAERSASCHCSCAAYQEYYKANAERLAERARSVARSLDASGERRDFIKHYCRKNGRKF